MSSSIHRIFTALGLLLVLAGCATMPANRLPEEPPMHSVNELQGEEKAALVGDPWEGFNRTMYNFNYRLDKYFLLPVVSGYEFITPDVVQTGVSNFFSNIVEIRNLTNSIMQLKGMEALTTLGRFLTNSTIGIGGLFDPATSFGLERRNEDFGQTLGYWGCDAGPYLVLPFFGPSSARDGSGLLVDAGIRYGIASAVGIDDLDNASAIKTGVETLEVIDKRHKESFRYYGSEFPFEYELIRFLYTKKREFESMK